jgi:hypothetical protein
MLAEGPAEERVRRFGSIAARAVTGMSAQCTVGPHGAGTMPGIAAQ